MTVKDLKKFDIFCFNGKIELYRHIYLGNNKYCDLAQHYGIFNISKAQRDSQITILGRVIEIPADNEQRVYRF